MRLKKIFHANGNDNKADLATLIPDKTDCKTSHKDKKGHSIMIQGSIQDEDITCI